MYPHFSPSPHSIVSPTVFREAGFRFYFLSREEPRVHVHVACAEGEAKCKLTNVTRPQPHHLFWPELDIALAVDSIRYPERFPLISRQAT